MSSASIPLSTDHPHAYGDKEKNIIEELDEEGSSPRVWGQAISVKISPQMAGIIPTRMGTRHSRRSMPLCRWDHPHAYGDKKLTLKNCRFCPGSSPRVWGQAYAWCRLGSENGIIPTRMGTRFLLNFMLSQDKDHPHAYGDKKILL